ncbi:MAG: cobalt transporter CbiM [Spirochaetota bacterium]|nr:cobalt transporter CbiM [Spirochaetota bacterium]
MHISDGVLSGPVCIGSSVVAAALIAYSLKKMENEEIPGIAVMTAAFFVASLIHIKIGPTSTHLVLNGLVGIILGISAIPAILVALLFHALMFQHGGITTLGVNSLAMSVPALISFGIFKSAKFIKSKSKFVTSLFSFISGSLAIIFSSIFTSLFLITAGQEFLETAKIVLVINAPIAIIEGFITLFVVSFLQRVKPDMINL